MLEPAPSLNLSFPASPVDYDSMLSMIEVRKFLGLSEAQVLSRVKSRQHTTYNFGNEDYRFVVENVSRYAGREYKGADKKRADKGQAKEVERRGRLVARERSRRCT